LAVHAGRFFTNIFLSVMAHKAIEITDANFEEIINSDKPVLVDFWAEWCGPCRMVGPVVEELAGEYEGKAIIGKVDVDANPQTSMKFGIRSIPTLLVFKNGQIVDKQVRRSQPAGTLDRTDPGWPGKGSSRCTLSHCTRCARYSRCERSSAEPLEIRCQAAEARSGSSWQRCSRKR